MGIKTFLFTTLLSTVISFSLSAQKQTISGTVKEQGSGESLIGANILIKEGVGTVTDYEGKFSIKVDPGTYNIKVSYVGYEPEERKVVVSNKAVNLSFSLTPVTISEVQVVADIARDRETPVAFSTVLPKKIEEQLSGRDLPMILNTTPGVYATEQGGGDGDARITIRGFSQRNVAVMLDGIPVNDMENGWVYWSNWFGLDQVTRSIQVQRGLSASRLALPSVGGTINIITKGIEYKKETSVQEFVDMYGKSTTSLGFTSGMLKHGWGITAASSFKKGSSWVENTDVEAFFLYLKLDKRWKNHITSLTGYGAPQTHDQRSYSRSIVTYNTDYASDHGVPVSELYVPKGDYIMNMGIDYNQHWGYIKRDADEWNADHSARIINPNAPTVILHDKVNTYFKPQFSLRDSWTVNDKLSVTNIAYMSIGRGGGEQPRYSLKNTNFVTPNDTLNIIFSPKDIGQIKWQEIYNTNSGPTNTGFQVKYPVDSTYSDNLYKSSNYMVENRNEHMWYGLLSNISYKPTNTWSFSGGLDLRSYDGIHYSMITDLLGGDYAVDKGDKRLNYDQNPSLAMKRVGDKVYFYDKGMVRWGGIFGLAEYKTGMISAFLNMSTYASGYKKIDYFGMTESPWKWKQGFTAKTGLNYNVTQRSNVFVNLGYLSRVKMLTYFYQKYSTEFVNDISNEKIMALEVGYAYNSSVFSANLNTYITKWENKPAGQVNGTYFAPDGQEIKTYGILSNMNANHKGVELDFVYKLSSKLQLQGLLSLGDWRWDKKVDNLQMYNTNTGKPTNTISFDSRGIHVGNAAQTQVGGSLRYEPAKNIYMEGRITYFGRHYAEFSPEAATDSLGHPVDSWKVPNYTLVDFHAGYRFSIPSIKKMHFNVRLNILNVLDELYISDATNNDSYIQLPKSDFDAKSASVFFGPPRYYSLSFKVTF